MNIFIRADSSITIGSGHIMRCLTFADMLVGDGYSVAFICRNIPGNLSQLIQAKGYNVSLLPDAQDYSWASDAKETAAILAGSQVDWLIVDHYQIDEHWERKQRKHVNRIMVIDDLANRRHDCELLLDQNLYNNLELRYAGLVPPHCRQLLGPRFALLRKEFYDARIKLKQRTGIVKNLLVFMGGADADNVTGRVIEAIQSFDHDNLFVDVVVGAINPHREHIETACAKMKNARYYCQVSNMADFLGRADLAIGAGGATTWERCFLGLPCLTVSIADNQVEMTEAVAAYGAAWDLGWHETVQAPDIARALRHALDDPQAVKRVSDKAFELMAETGSGRKVLISELAR